jgi:hypothetical protein
MTVVKYKIKYRNLRGGDDEPEEKKVGEEQEEQEKREQQQEEDAGEGADAPMQEPEQQQKEDAGEGADAPMQKQQQEDADVSGSDITTDPQNEVPPPAVADEGVSEPTDVVGASQAPAPAASTMFSFGSLFGTSGPSQADYDALKAENAELRAALTSTQGPIMTGGDIPDITISFSDM